ncbi:MAG: hypothetical protein AAFZ02_08830 [Pseudomonadota bacterium]
MGERGETVELMVLNEHGDHLETLVLRPVALPQADIATLPTPEELSDQLAKLTEAREALKATFGAAALIRRGLRMVSSCGWQRPSASRKATSPPPLKKAAMCPTRTISGAGICAGIQADFRRVEVR